MNRHPSHPSCASHATGLLLFLFLLTCLSCSAELPLLVTNPLAAVQGALPPGWKVLKSQANTYPSYRPKGAGEALFLGVQGKKYLKEQYSAALFIMPPDYADGEEDPTHGKAASWPARLIATTRTAKLYLWPGPEAEDWKTLQKDLLKALIKTPTRESAVELLRQEIATVIPKNWAAAQTNNDTVVVRRLKPLRMVNLINAPLIDPSQTEESYRAEHSFMSDYLVAVRLGMPTSAQPLMELRRENERAKNSLDQLEKKMRSIDHKFDQYVPRTAEEKTLVAEYGRTKAAQVIVPEYQFNGFAALIAPNASDLLTFFLPANAQECAEVRRAITSCLEEWK